MIVGYSAATLTPTPSGDVQPRPWDNGRGLVLLKDLLSRLDELPAQRPAAMQIVRMTRDDDMSSSRLAAVVGRTPRSRPGSCAWPTVRTTACRDGSGR